MVPNLPLGSVIDIKHGFAFDSEYFRERSTEYVLLTPGNFHVEKRLYFGPRTKFYDGPIPDGYILANDDLLVVMTDLTKDMAILGNAVLLKSDKSVLHNQRIGLVTIKDEGRVDKRFLCELLNSDIIQRHIRATASGTTVRHTAPKRILEIGAPIPPLPEQRKIADILSTWDAAIEKTEALLATAKAQKRALMQSLLTGKRRFPEFEGQPWEEVRLGDVATIAMGSSPKSSAYNNEGVGLPLIQGNADVKNGRSAPRAFTSEITTRCSPGDILFSVRAPVGSVAISDHNACVGRGAAVIRPTTEHDWFWLKHLMLWLEPQWARVSQGSTFEAVNSKDLKTFTVPMPSTKAEESLIGSVVEAAHLECSTLMAQIAKLRTEKKALMQQLLTGKRRVMV